MKGCGQNKVTVWPRPQVGLCIGAWLGPSIPGERREKGS